MPEPLADPKLNPTTVLLLGRCKEGDRDALDALVVRFYPPVFRMVRARMGPVLARKEGVEDLVQDTFLQVLRGLDSYELRPDAHFIAYLAKVAQATVVNKLDYYRAEKRAAEREVPIQKMRTALGESTYGHQLVRGSASPGSKAAAQEMEDIVDSCVSRLEEAHREVILLKDYAGADWAFIAEQLGRTVGAAQQLHQRARAKLSDAVRAFD